MPPHFEALPTHPVTKLAMRMIALTVISSGTLHTTPWTEFTSIATDPVWRIPAERMKITREFWIPLSRQALE